MSDGGRGRASLGGELWKSSQKWSVRRSAVRSIAWLDVLCAVKSRPNILRPLERFSLFRDVLPERVGQIGRDVVPGFGGESIEKGPVFITDPAPREPPDRAIGRVAEQAPQDGTVGRPALGIQHAQMKLKEAVFVAPEHRGHVTVQDEAILIGQSFAVGGARYDVANPGIAQAREEFDVARASSLLH
jgi:hypothetical protein